MCADSRAHIADYERVYTASERRRICAVCGHRAAEHGPWAECPERRPGPTDASWCDECQTTEELCRCRDADQFRDHS